jgi:hypothetical protein
MRRTHVVLAAALEYVPILGVAVILASLAPMAWPAAVLVLAYGARNVNRVRFYAPLLRVDDAWTRGAFDEAEAELGRIEKTPWISRVSRRSASVRRGFIALARGAADDARRHLAVVGAPAPLGLDDGTWRIAVGVRAVAHALAKDAAAARIDILRLRGEAPAGPARAAAELAHALVLLQRGDEAVLASHLQAHRWLLRVPLPARLGYLAKALFVRDQKRGRDVSAYRDEGAAEQGAVGSPGPVRAWIERVAPDLAPYAAGWPTCERMDDLGPLASPASAPASSTPRSPRAGRDDVWAQLFRRLAGLAIFSPFLLFIIGSLRRSAELDAFAVLLAGTLFASLFYQVRAHAQRREAVGRAIDLVSVELPAEPTGPDENARQPGAAPRVTRQSWRATLDAWARGNDYAAGLAAHTLVVVEFGAGEFTGALARCDAALERLRSSVANRLVVDKLFGTRAVILAAMGEAARAEAQLAFAVERAGHVPAMSVYAVRLIGAYRGDAPHAQGDAARLARAYNVDAVTLPHVGTLARRVLAVAESGAMPAEPGFERWLAAVDAARPVEPSAGNPG